MKPGEDVFDEYSPEAIRFWLTGRCPRCRWAMLESAVEGGTGASGMGSGRGKRLSLVLIKADLERAADSLPLYWQSTEFIFRRQHRAESLYKARRTTMAIPEHLRDAEHPVPSVALDNAIWAMSRFLGWAEPLPISA
jgi:hypothetical protein